MANDDPFEFATRRPTADHPRINPDRMIYFVLCRYRDGLAWAERDAGRTNKRDTLEDILSGSLPNVLQVIELNFIEFISRDVTEDFLPKALREVIRDKLTADQDHARDLRKNWVA